MSGKVRSPVQAAFARRQTHVVPTVLAPPPMQTLAKVYQDIVAGVRPWLAFNEFLHEWFDYAKDTRAALITAPLGDDGPPGEPERAHDDIAAETPGARVPHQERWRWAVFCAAAADYLCARYGVPRPAWLEARDYTLTEPWYGFDSPGTEIPEGRARLEQTTPAALRRRNILAGDRVFANKYEWVEEYRAMRAQRAQRAGQPN